MRPSEMYRRIGLARGGWSCLKKKEQYLSQADAAKASLAHTRRIAVCYGVNEYWCSQHRCWHWGHVDKYREAKQSMREDILWFAVRQTQSNARNAPAPSNIGHLPGMLREEGAA